MNVSVHEEGGRYSTQITVRSNGEIFLGHKRAKRRFFSLHTKILDTSSELIGSCQLQTCNTCAHQPHTHCSPEPVLFTSSVPHDACYAGGRLGRSYPRTNRLWAVLDDHSGGGTSRSIHRYLFATHLQLVPQYSVRGWHFCCWQHSPI